MSISERNKEVNFSVRRGKVMEILHTVASTIARHPFAAINIVALIVAFLSMKIRQYIIMALSRAIFIFVRRTYLHKSLGDAFIAYLLKNDYKCYRSSGELYGEDPAFIRSENEVKHILYKDVNSNIQIFYPAAGIHKGWPIFVSGTPLIQAKDTVKNYAYMVYTPRWSKKYLSLLEAATDMKNSKEDDGDDADRFIVKKVSGAGGKAAFQIERGKAEARQEKHTLVSESELADPFSTYIPTRWEKDNIGQVVFHNSLEMMSLNKELEDTLEEIKFWLDNQEWYEERGIPWKRGLLFYGKPGCGKTMFTRALAEKLNLPLLIFDLASMDSTEFNHAWGQLLPRRIVLFEDFDSIFIKRHNVMNSGLDFSTILNALDGADKKQGILTIITTNYPEKLDFALGGPIDGLVVKLKTEDDVSRYGIVDKENGALVDVGGAIGYSSEAEASEALKFNGGKMPSRPGRIDRSVEFIPLSKAGRIKLAMRILKDEKLAEKIVNESENDSAAQIQERAFRLATSMLFNKKTEP